MANKIIEELFNRKKKQLLVVPIHGIRLHFHCDQKVLLNGISRYLRYFLERQGKAKGRTTHCSITIVAERDYKQYQKLYRAQKDFEAFPGVRASVGSIHQHTAYEIKTSCLIIIDDQTNDCACLLRRSADKKLIHTDMMVHILLIEWLRGRGLFFIHSSAVCCGGKAYLFIGPSGAGKTTTALMGVQRGLSFMGDDLLIVKEDGGGIKIHSYIEDVKFCLDMIGRFKELKKITVARETVNRKTKSVKFDVKKFFDAKIADKASVSKIFFLNRGRSLKRLRPQDALPLLMSNSFFYSRQETSVKHFELLCRLIYSVDSYLVGRSFINRHYEKLVE